MKPAILALSFLLFAFPLAFSNDFRQTVLDVDGNPVVPGSEYFILTNLIGQKYRGVVTLRITGNSTCPATVEVYFGLYASIPVKFTPAGVNTSEIFTNTQLEIKFPKDRVCVESPKWVVVVDSDMQQTYVGIGGPEDHPGQQTYSGTFKILTSSNDKYGLAFCKPIIDDEPSVCWNISLHFIAKHLSLLVLTNNKGGFEFGLKKAEAYPGIRTVV